MLLLLPYTEYLGRLAEPRNIADIVLVFLLVYAVLKLVRGTRAAATVAGIAAFAVYFKRAVDRAEDSAEKHYRRSEDLLHNILPDTVAELARCVASRVGARS